MANKIGISSMSIILANIIQNIKPMLIPITFLFIHLECFFINEIINNRIFGGGYLNTNANFIFDWQSKIFTAIFIAMLIFWKKINSTGKLWALVFVTLCNVLAVVGGITGTLAFKL